MRDLFWPFHRTGVPQAQAMRFGYEKAGIFISNEPIPWNADAVYVNVLVRFPSGLGRLKSDFQLEIDGLPPQTAQTLHPSDVRDLFRLEFRLPPLTSAAAACLRWRRQVIGQVLLPLLTLTDFVDNLRVQAASAFVRIGDQTVPASACVVSQCRGLIAGGLLASPTCLAPLVDLELTVEFHDDAGNEILHLPVHLTSRQLQAREVLVNIVSPRRPDRVGVWSIQWLLCGRVLARNELRLLSQRVLKPSLYLADGRFAVHDQKTGQTRLSRQPPKVAASERLAPCFLVSCREPGIAALVELEAAPKTRGGQASPLVIRQDVLVTDGPSLFLPGTIPADCLQDIEGFELRYRGKVLGQLSLQPAPAAKFSSEGGFVAAEEYAWSSSFDTELQNRMARLAQPD